MLTRAVQIEDNPSSVRLANVEGRGGVGREALLRPVVGARDIGHVGPHIVQGLRYQITQLTRISACIRTTNGPEQRITIGRSR